MARIAIYGGAFNPPHLAHLFAVTTLLSRQDVDAVWLMPTAQHAFGKAMAPFEDRVAMVRKALAGPFGDRAQLCLVEAERDGPSRTYDTLDLLSQRYPEHRFVGVIGADNLSESHRWYRFDELTARWPFIVMGRPGHEAALAERAHLPWCNPGPTLPDVSSTAIRAALAGGAPEALAWLPQCIVARARELYGQPVEVELPKTWILGAGRVGGALSAAYARLGSPALGVWNRTPKAGATASGVLPDLHEAELVVLCVSDPAVKTVAAQLKGKVRPGTVVLHTAGRFGAEVLAELPGVEAGSLHPLQSIVDPRAGRAFSGITVAVEGTPAALAVARHLAESLDAHPVEIPPGGKAAYHCAAVLAANFVVTLGHGGVRLLEGLGVDAAKARAMLTPLLEGTVSHFSSKPFEHALTGPLKRKDFEAVAMHAEALADTLPEFLETYRTLARRTAELLGWSASELQRLDATFERR